MKSDRELMQMALDALEEIESLDRHKWGSFDKAIEELRARLAQPEIEDLGEIVPTDEEQLKRIEKLVSLEPKPVAWALQQPLAERIGTMPVAFKRHDEFGFTVPLYAAPPQQNEFNPDWDAMAAMVEEQQRMAKRIEELEQREWQGLTDEEIMNAAESRGGVNFAFARAIETKLREKNK